MESVIENSKITDLLQCPVCLGVFEERIFLCKNGHALCETCHGKLNSCPQCREVFQGTRNFALEQIIKIVTDGNTKKKAEKPPKVKGSGEQGVLIAAGPKQGRGKFKCRINGCKQNLPICRLLNHCRQFHKERLTIAVKEECQRFYSHDFTIPMESYSAVYQLPKFGLFFLLIRVEKSEVSSRVYAWVQTASPIGYAKTIRYNVELEFVDKKAGFHDIPHTVAEKAERIIAAEECLRETTSQIKGVMKVSLKVRENSLAKRHNKKMKSSVLPQRN